MPTKLNMAGMANTQSGRISDLLSTPFNPTGWRAGGWRPAMRSRTIPAQAATIR